MRISSFLVRLTVHCAVARSRRGQLPADREFDPDAQCLAGLAA
ncbi:MAG TPA: hypothetical protein VE673_14155 [Pseudonocardiaceae bacterium]|nr:hypothetical protein [Pseudonocardiaceae bacterium]